MVPLRPKRMETEEVLEKTRIDAGIRTRSELAEAGLADDQIRRMVRSGLLLHLRRNWYALPSADPAAVEAVRMGGCLSCVSSLKLHDYWVAPGYSGVHRRVSKHGDLHGKGVCRGYGKPLPLTAGVDPIPVALLYAARCMSAEDWIATCDSVLNKNRLKVPQLAELMPCVPKSVGYLMAKCDGRSQSGTESIARVRLRALGFEVEVQPNIEDVGWVDLRIGKLLIECDSKQHHTKLDDYQRDRHRDRIALGQGWMTMRLTYDDVLFGWDESVDAIRSVTRRGKHRVRKRAPE